MKSITSLSDADYVRILCKESGHWWADTGWKGVRRRDGKTCLRRTQSCERDGCERIRYKDITTRTNVPLGPYQYKGEQQKLGRVYLDELYREQIKRQKWKAA